MEQEKTLNPSPDLPNLKTISKLYLECSVMSMLDVQDASKLYEKGLKEPLKRAEKIREGLGVIPNLIKSIDTMREVIERNRNLQNEMSNLIQMYCKEEDLNVFREQLDVIGRQCLANGEYLMKLVPRHA